MGGDIGRPHWGTEMVDRTADLWERAASGDSDAVDELVEQAADQQDLPVLRRLAAIGSSDAVDVLVELAGERGDVVELRRLAELGSSDAADVLAGIAVDDHMPE